MKKFLILSLILMLALPLGCSKKEKEEGEAVKQAESKSGMKASLVDPVSKEPVDIVSSPYYYVYKDVEYHFQTEENMKAFKKDPEKYLKMKTAE